MTSLHKTAFRFARIKIRRLQLTKPLNDKGYTGTGMIIFLKKIQGWGRRQFFKYLGRLTHRYSGVLWKHGDKVHFFRGQRDIGVRTSGDSLRYDQYEDWKHVQTMKGKPEVFEKLWEKTKEKQIAHWEFAGLQGGLRMLEIGFRDGENLVYLRNRGIDIDGIEVNAAAVEHARELGCQAHEADIQQRTHYQDQEFDLISACRVLEHCFAPDQALREMHRILKDDGRVVIEVPFEESFDINLIHGHSSLFRNPEHAESIFENAGFSVVNTDFSRPRRNRFLLMKALR